MTDRHLDYDPIAPGYDQRFAAGSGQRGIAAALRSLAEAHAPTTGRDRTGAPAVGRILEVGCGTGYWLAGLCPVAGTCFGLDISGGMLAQARVRDQRLALMRGRACELPLADACAELVYCVNAIHHFQRPRDFLLEARRLLRPGGMLAIAGMDPRAHRHRWYIYDYFLGTYETDLDRFPSWGEIVDWMIDAGLERIEWRLVERIEDHKTGREVFADPFLQKNACSQLALLSDEAYAAGLRRIATALTESEAKGGRITFCTDLWQAMLVGWAGG